jgi:hypothetical protein
MSTKERMTPASERHHRLADIGAGEEDGRQRLLGPDHELRADDAGDDAAGHDPGDGLGPERVGGRVGGGEAVALGGRGVEPGEKVARQKTGKLDR